MNMGNYFSRLFDDFLTNEPFWHNEVSDLQKTFPFLYNYPQEESISNSKERYYLLYPKVEKSQKQAYEFLRTTLMIKQKKSSLENDETLKDIKIILQDMEYNYDFFFKASITQREELLTKWNKDIINLQIDTSSKQIVLSGITMLSTDTINDLKKLKNLTSLKIINSRILYLPNSIEKLYQLKSIKIISSKLAYLPSNIFELKKVESLILNDNNIRFISEDLTNLSNLKKLDLSSNLIRFLPDTSEFSKLLEKLGITREDILASQKSPQDTHPKTIGAYWANRLEQQNISNLSNKKLK